MLKRLLLAAAFFAMSAAAPFAQPFNPTATVSLSVTSSSARVALPTGGGTSAKVCNTGSNTAFVKFGDSTVTSSATDNTASVTPVVAGACEALSPNGGTNIAAITSSSTTTLSISTGNGQPSGFGGGSGSGSSGFTPTATPASLTAWSSATALNATQALMTNSGYSALLVMLQQGSTISGGAVTFEGTYDGTNWVTIPVANQVLNPNTFAPLTNPYTLVQSTNQPFLLITQGYSSVRIKLSTQITGSGTVTPVVTLWPTDSLPGAMLNQLPTGTNTIGNVGVVANALGGATPAYAVAANSNNSTSLKGTAGTVYGLQTSNINSTTAYFVKLYDKATAPTCGSDTPVAGYVIPPSNGGNNVPIAVGKKFALGIGYCIVAGIANSDNTSVPAATILLNVDWN